jgi:hypothetical protein
LRRTDVGLAPSSPRRAETQEESPGEASPHPGSANQPPDYFFLAAFLVFLAVFLVAFAAFFAFFAIVSSQGVMD